MKSLLQIFAKFSFNNGFTKMPFYAVRKGRQPGVYRSWPECKAQVEQFQYASYRKFTTEEEAWSFVNSTPEKSFYSPSKHTSPQTSASPGPSRFPPLTPSHSNAAAAQAPPVIEQPSTSTSGPMRISSTRILALRGTINNMKALSEQLRQYVTHAEEQLDAITRGKKRTAEEASVSSLAVDDAPTHNKQSRQDVPNGSTSGPVAVYTDGCCHSNGREGGQAGIGVYWGEDDPRNVAERLPGRQTNNRAEIHAACRAILQAKERGISDLIIHTDSQFTINGITKWIHKWKQNGWRLANGGQVINRDDFEELDGLLADKRVNVTWVHVDGHSGIPGNEAADRLANAGARL